MNINIKQFRARMREILDRGDPVTITSRGKSRARLVSITIEDRTPLSSELPAFGMWKDRDGMADVGAWVRREREGSLGRS